MDNWFTNWETLQFCTAKGIQMVGTLRVDRKGFAAKQEQALSADAARGSLKVLRHTASSAYVAIWQDTKPVRVVSNFHTDIGTCLRSVNTDGKWEKTIIEQPQSVGCYNDCRSAVDRGDASKALIRPVLRSRRPVRNSFLDKIIQNVNQARIIKNSLMGCDIKIQRAAEVIQEYLAKRSVETHSVCIASCPRCFVSIDACPRLCLAPTGFSV